MHTACLHNCLEAVEMMMVECPQLCILKDSCGSIPVMEAARSNSVKIVDLLCQTDPSWPKLQDSVGRNTLHVASHSGHVEVIELLVRQQKMDPNDASCPSRPLHWAAKEGQVQAVTCLLEMGADPTAEDLGGRIPLALAIGGQHVEAARVLVRHDPLLPFDVTLLAFARTASMKQMLSETFQSLWNIVLYLPGTD